MRGEGDDNQNSLLDQTDESFDVDDEDVLEDAAKVPSFVEEDEEEDTLFDKKKTNERATDDINISEKTPNATLKVPKTAPPRKREKSTVRVAPLTKETSRGKKTALEQSPKKKDG